MVSVFSFNAMALNVTEEFTSNTYKGSSQLVWNTKLGYLHAPIQITGFNDQGVIDDLSIDVGDGTHGDFNSSTYSQFAETVDSVNKIIYVNTDTYTELKVKSFHLTAGWTLRPTGGNPLVIKSLSTVVIEGMINCNGEDGGSITSNASDTVSGGQGFCGGGDGGSSLANGATASSSNNGSAGGPSVTGGDVGSAGANGGGGGGGYIKDNAVMGDKPDGEDGVGAGGGKGTNIRDDDFLDEPSGAGSGGGGGSAQAGVSSGGGGGGGGGAVHIFAVGDITITTDGSVYANGGEGGGTTNAGLTGGGGGGGAGGSIWIVSMGDVVTDGFVRAEPGDGGDVPAGNNGGNGYWGRTWLVDKDFLTGIEAEEPQTNLILPGTVEFIAGVTHTTESSAIDLYNSEPILSSHTVGSSDLGAATLTFEVAQSDSENSGYGAWEDPSGLVGVELKRYVKFRIQLDNQSASTSAKVTSVVLSYSGNTQTDFDFVTGCGMVSSGNPPPSWPNILMAMLLITLPLVTTRILASHQFLN